jgi:hypothetical protein
MTSTVLKSVLIALWKRNCCELRISAPVRAGIRKEVIPWTRIQNIRRLFGCYVQVSTEDWDKKEGYIQVQNVIQHYFRVSVEYRLETSQRTLRHSLQTTRQRAELQFHFLHYGTRGRHVLEGNSWIMDFQNERLFDAITH